MTLAPGTKLGPYEILSPLGAGGMGEVWKAKDARLDRFVAIKVLPEHLTANAEALARFEREAKAVAMLDHPNLVSLFDVGREGGTFFAVMELLDGETLRMFLARQRPTLRQAVDLARQMAQGLAAAHHRGIVHRDLKPENVFVLRDGRVKLLDFGLAKRVEMPRGAEASTLLGGAPVDSAAGSLVGTVGYMSPEQVRGQPADGRSDIFAFGCVLFELLSGRRAFSGATAVEALHAILHAEPELEDEAIPPGLRLLLGHCLDKDPMRRFHDAQDLAFALEGSSLSGKSLSVPSTAPPARAWKTLGLLAAGVLFLAAGYVVGRRSSPPGAHPVFIQVAFEPLMVLNARFMPDGQTLLVSAVRPEQAPQILEIRPDSQVPKPLGPPGTHLLSISRNGEWLVLADATPISLRLCRGTLARMKPEGAPRPVDQHVREADWAPDGQTWALVRDLGNERDRLEYPSGTPLYEAGGYLSDPRVSPDGSRVAFFEHPSKYDDRGVLKTVDRGGRVIQHSGEFSALEGLAWSGDGAVLHFSAQELQGSEGMHPCSVDLRTPGRVRPTFKTAGQFILYDLSPTGALAGSRESFRRGIRGRLPGDAADREFTWLDECTGGVLSRDFRWVGFTNEKEGGNYQVVLRRTDGSPPAILGEGRAAGLSPDGQWAVSDVETPFRLMLYPTGAGTPRQVETGALRRALWVHWLPGGQELLLVGQEPSQPLKVYKLSLKDGDRPLPVSLPGLAQTKGSISVSPDSSRILGVRDDGQAGLFDLKTGSFSRLPVLETAFSAVCGWSRDGREVYVRDPGKLPIAVQRMEVATGKLRPVPDIRCDLPDGTVQARGFKIYETDAGRATLYSYEVHSSELYLVRGLR